MMMMMSQTSAAPTMIIATWELTIRWTSGAAGEMSDEPPAEPRADDEVSVETGVDGGWRAVRREEARIWPPMYKRKMPPARVRVRDPSRAGALARLRGRWTLKVRMRAMLASSQASCMVKRKRSCFVNAWSPVFQRILRRDCMGRDAASGVDAPARAQCLFSFDSQAPHYHAGLPVSSMPVLFVKMVLRFAFRVSSFEFFMFIPDILQQIVATKKCEVAAAVDAVPLEEMKGRARAAAREGGGRDFFAALTKKPRGLVNIIAEIKKASPSAGVFREDAVFDPVGIARVYHAAGADALSVLTDERYFGGKLEYLQMVKDAVPLPILRKDFLIDPYQVYQARAAGADAVLLIAEILSDAEMLELRGIAEELGMAVLMEVHERESLMRVRDVIGEGEKGRGGERGRGTLLGINNRDLRNFGVDLETTVRLAELVENQRILVAESGIKNRADVRRVAAAGVRSLLVGETLMRAGDVAGTMMELKGVGGNSKFEVRSSKQI